MGGVSFVSIKNSILDRPLFAFCVLMYNLRVQFAISGSATRGLKIDKTQCYGSSVSAELGGC